MRVTWTVRVHAHTKTSSDRWKEKQPMSQSAILHIICNNKYHCQTDSLSWNLLPSFCQISDDKEPWQLSTVQRTPVTYVTSVLFHSFYLSKVMMAFPQWASLWLDKGAPHFFLLWQTNRWSEVRMAAIQCKCHHRAHTGHSSEQVYMHGNICRLVFVPMLAVEWLTYCWCIPYMMQYLNPITMTTLWHLCVYVQCMSNAQWA